MAAMKSNKAAIYADAGGLTEFEFPAALMVKVYTSKAASLDAAESASINEIQQGLAGFEGNYHLDYKPINVSKVVTPDFRCLPLHAECQDYLNTIVSIEKEGSNWPWSCETAGIRS